MKTYRVSTVRGVLGISDALCTKDKVPIGAFISTEVEIDNKCKYSSQMILYCGGKGSSKGGLESQSQERLFLRLRTLIK